MPRKLGTRQLDTLIADHYKVAARGKMINILDIGKVYKAARDVYALTSDVEAVKAEVDKGVAAYCTRAA